MISSTAFLEGWATTSSMWATGPLHICKRNYGNPGLLTTILTIKVLFLVFMEKKKKRYQTFLVAQWLGIHLPMQGDTGSIPGLGRFHVPLGKWACAPLQLSPSTLEPVLRNKRSHCNEKPVQCTATETQCSQEKKKITTQSACLCELTQNLSRISKDLVKLGYGRRKAYQGKVYLETETCPDKPEFSLQRDRKSGKRKRMELWGGTGSERDRRRRLWEVRESNQ